MKTERKLKKRLRLSSNAEYLHKDFHGALCQAVKYLDDHYGKEHTRIYLKQFAGNYYSPVSVRLKENGLQELEKHWQRVFSLENGDFEQFYDNGKLVLKVNTCPAIAHLKKIGQFVTERFCQTTKVVNETICNNAGYNCSCHYEQGEGRCVQTFWKE
jgi:hypothetical protein